MKIDVNNCRIGRVGRSIVGAGTMAGLAALLAMAVMYARVGGGRSFFYALPEKIGIPLG